jgi:hypothetical protein
MPLLAARQEKLLQGLMREIVRMTAQKQPLEMGVPLYPFSHASLFASRTQSTGGVEEDPAGGMPLPSSPPVEEAPCSPGTLSSGLSPLLSSAHRSGWPSGSPGQAIIEEEIIMTTTRGPYI